MADKVYLMRADDLTPAMAGLADNIEDAKCITVLSADVSNFEAGLPRDETTWMSSDKSEVTYVEGYQADGIPLPKHVVEG